MIQIETDSDSGAEVYQFTDGPRPTDNIYGEQPYSSVDGGTIAVRHYPVDGTDGGLSILNIGDRALHTVLDTMPLFPAFHAWGEHLYFQKESGGDLLLKRCEYATGRTETVMVLPTDMGKLSYGAMSPDIAYYAVSAHGEDGFCQVLLLDVESSRAETWATTTEHYFKHEQFAQDGSNRLLIQANLMPEVKHVYLGVLEISAKEVEWLAADDAHTPRPTGHENWIGSTASVFFSTDIKGDDDTNIWTVGVGDTAPSLACECPIRFGHVSASRCGRFWIADCFTEGVPIYAGSFETGRHRRLVDSGTAHDDDQWSHTHPYLTSDNQWLIYTSTRAGLPQVYGAKVDPSFWDSLSEPV